MIAQDKAFIVKEGSLHYKSNKTAKSVKRSVFSDTLRKKYAFIIYNCYII